MRAAMFSPFDCGRAIAEPDAAPYLFSVMEKPWMSRKVISFFVIHGGHGTFLRSPALIVSFRAGCCAVPDYLIEKGVSSRKVIMFVRLRRSARPSHGVIQGWRTWRKRHLDDSNGQNQAPLHGRLSGVL